MLRTRVCELLGIEHPIVMGGMGTGTSPELVAAVSSAGAWASSGRAVRAITSWRARSRRSVAPPIGPSG